MARVEITGVCKFMSPDTGICSFQYERHSTDIPSLAKNLPGTGANFRNTKLACKMWNPQRPLYFDLLPSQIDCSKYRKGKPISLANTKSKRHR